MKKYFIVFIVLIACNKTTTQDKLQTGCEYGVNKSTGNREFIQCVPREVYAAGTNQTAVNSICDSYGIARIDISIVKNYSDLDFTVNANCNCQ